MTATSSLPIPASPISPAPWTLLGFGVAFMVYPYFTQSIAALIAVGAGLGVALWVAIKAGW